MTLRLAIKIMQMTKKAMRTKYGKAAPSKFIDARLKIKESGLSLKKAKNKAFSKAGKWQNENFPVSKQMIRDDDGRNLRKQAKKRALDR